VTRLALLALMLALLLPSPRTREVIAQRLVRGQGEGSSSQATTAPRFDFIDIYIDPQGKPLAAYQFELSVDPAAATIVGVEGGDHPAFSAAPYYDPEALTKNRIIIAAFNTGSDLPNTKTRVARVHLRVTREKPDFHLHLDTAASADGRESNDAVISLGTGVKP
jgi:hypothetical protein